MSCSTGSTPTPSRFARKPDDYLLFLGRFTDGKGVLQAIELAKRVGMRLILAAAEDDYYREKVAPHVDGRHVVYYGEADFDAKVKLYGGARALLYPIQAREPFGLVLAEAMACGTPVAALDKGAVREVVDDGVTGLVFENLETMANELSRVFDLDRRRVRERAVARFGAARMVDEYIRVYNRIIEDPSRMDAPTRTVLAVFAHPDDESLMCGGTIARLADAGVRVVLMCASRGEHGSVSDPALVPEGDISDAFAAPNLRKRPRFLASPKSSRSITLTATSAGATCPNSTPRSWTRSSATGPRRCSRSPKTGCTGTWITSASMSGRSPRS